MLPKTICLRGESRLRELDDFSRYARTELAWTTFRRSRRGGSPPQASGTAAQDWGDTTEREGAAEGSGDWALLVKFPTTSLNTSHGTPPPKARLKLRDQLCAKLGRLSSKFRIIQNDDTNESA